MTENKLRQLSDSELQKQLKKYRLLTLVPLLLGLLVTVLLIWFDRERSYWPLVYFLMLVILLPLILKSGRLHREWRRRM